MLKIYGSMLCPDCVQCCKELEDAQVPYEYYDFAESLCYLKEFLKLRDEDKIFDGPPCFRKDRHSVYHPPGWNGYVGLG